MRNIVTERPKRGLETRPRAQERHKKYRLSRRQAKQKEEELRITREGITYEAAGFDETQLCRVTKKKKQKRN